LIGSSTSRILSHLSVIITAVLVIAVLYVAKIVFLPLAFAILFAFLLAPAVSLLERIHLPRVMAVLVVILGFGVILGSIGWAVVVQLISVADDLPTYRANITEKIEAIHSPKNSAFGRARGEVEHLNQQLGLASATTIPDLHAPEKKQLGATPERPVQVQEVARPTGRLDQVNGILEPLLTCFLTVVFTFFVLLEREDLRNRVIGLTAHGHLNLMTQAMNDASLRISRYFSLQLMVNTVYGSIVFLALHFIGLPHALLFGALAALLRFIPYIGAPVATILPTILSLAVFHEWTNSLYIVSLFLFLEVITANYAEPRLYGRHTGLSSLAILIAAAFWTLIWGPVGLVLSVPLTVCLVVVGRHVPYLEFLTVMLGDQPAIPPSSCFYQRLLARDEREAELILETYLKDKTLKDLYDAVVIPALHMSEQDRYQNDLEESTERFIHQTTRELIEDLGQREDLDPEKETIDDDALEEPKPTKLAKVLCVPVRDDGDELGAIMLGQLIERAGLQAVSIPVRRVDEVLATAAQEEPEIVFLSGMPPFAMARARRLYKSLHARNPHLKIMIGIWNYTDDETKAAQEISRGGEEHISTTMAQALSQIRTFLGEPDASQASFAKQSPLLEVHSESAA
jgi:predicted PurR-regulated permease PerM/predicted N-acetyltransferase YhbS